MEENIIFTGKGGELVRAKIMDRVIEIKVNRFTFNLQKQGRENDHNYRLTHVTRLNRILAGFVYKKGDKFFATDTLREHVSKCPIRSAVELINDIVYPDKSVYVT